MTGTFLTEEMLDCCIASETEINHAITNGKKMAFNDENGKLTAYLRNDKVYVTELEIKPEAFE